MPNIDLIQVHYCVSTNEQGRCEQSRTVEERPISQDIPAIKLQISKIVAGLRGKNYAYFYVVLKARKTDGSFGYRTVIPKTML